MQSEPRREANPATTAGCFVLVALFAVVACVVGAAAGSAFIKPRTQPEFVPRPTEVPLAPPTLSPDEVHYVSELGNITVEHSAAVGAVRGLLMKATNDSSLLNDEGWRDQTSAWLEVVRVTDEQLRNLDAPARFAGCHDSLMGAVDLYDLVITTTAVGVDSGDSHMIEMSVRLVDFGNTDLQKALECVKQVNR